MLSILLLNCSRHGDFGSNLVDSSKILVAMVTKMVLTWRVDFESYQLKVTNNGKNGLKLELSWKLLLIID